MNSGSTDVGVARSAWPKSGSVGSRLGTASLILVALSVIWALRFIWSTSFRFGSHRVFCLFDDAMISLTYARSLVEGRGLTWGMQTEPVEGFTNPMWTFAMALVELMPLSAFHRPLLVQLGGLAVLLSCWWSLARLLRRLLRPEWRRGSVVLAGACMAVYPLWYWSLLGLEVGLQALVLSLLATAAVDSAQDEKTLRSVLVVGMVAPLVRMDLLLGVAISATALWIRGRRRQALQMGFAAGASLVAYQAFRWFYFGAVLPNTYYLKMTGEPLEDRVERGLHLLSVNPALVLVGVVFLAVLIWAARRGDVCTAAVVSIPLAYMTYTVYVGGDAWDPEFGGVSRFTASALPLGVCALIATLGRIELRGIRLGLRHAVAASMLLVPMMNGWLGPGGLERLDRQLGFDSEPYLVSSHRVVFSEVQALEQRFGGYDLSVSTCWAGIPAYFSDFRWIDCLGYTDRELARQPVNGPAGALDRGIVAGHNKRYPELVLERQPDVVYQLWGYGRVDPLLTSRGYRRTAEGWWVKRGLLRRLSSQD